MYRAQERISVERYVQVKLSGGQLIKARIVNLSHSGLALLYPAPADPGAVLGLRFLLPDNKNEPVVISCQGIVRNCHFYKNQFVTGLEFQNMAEHEKEILHQFIRQKLSRQSKVVIAA